MDEYRLQVEPNDETRREIHLQSEKQILHQEIENQKRLLAEKFYTIFGNSGLVVLFYAIAAFLLKLPFDSFLLIILTTGYLAEIAWLVHGLRKRTKNLEDWKKLN